MRASDPEDEQLEAWFKRHRARIARLSAADLKPVAPWLPIIDLPANDEPPRRGD